MKTVTVSQLCAILAKVKGATPVTFVAVTDARARKTNNPHTVLGPVYRTEKVNGMVGTDHEAAVVRQQAREGALDPAYVAQARSWGERVGPALVKKGDSYYLPVQLNPAQRSHPVYIAPKWRGTKVRLLPVATEAIAPFLPSERREERAAHQGVERLVDRRDYKLESIASLSIDGEQYRVRS